MAHAVSQGLLAAAALGLGVLLAQLACLWRHLRRPAPVPRRTPGISILKPLCGIDDELEANLLCFADLDWPEYEVLLGARDARDAAWPLARALERRFPGRFRAVLQRGEPGANPKVNQLVTLAAAARHDLLVVSDSNVRVERGYLAEIAAHLEDPAVGLVTHLIAGAGERRLGSLFDHLQLAGGAAPGVAAAKRLAGRDIVVGKSMALRRADLAALGGFSAVKDVLAEDYVLGTMVTGTLGKRVALARRPVANVSVSRDLGDFASRYARWAVLHRSITGRAVHLGQALLNPVLLALAAAVLEPGRRTGLALCAVAAAKAAVDGACGRLLRPGGFRAWQLALAPAKDLLFALAWGRAFVSSEVVWRGRRIRVLEGTRLGLEAAGAAEAAPAAPGVP
jgi:ceramide glucosyltransferase